jgi:hypothetical protein
MMSKKDFLFTLDNEDLAKEWVVRLNKELRMRELDNEYYVHYLTHRLAGGQLTYALYRRKRKEVTE